MKSSLSFISKISFILGFNSAGFLRNLYSRFLNQERDKRCGLSPAFATSYFNIERLNIEEKAGEIKNIVDVVQPPNKFKIVIFRIVIGLLIMLTLILIFFTEEPSSDDIYKKKIKNIFKSHGTRLVAINNELIIANESYQDVHSIDDLVKISDELEKPIMYIYDTNITKMNNFYVIDNNGFYVYTVSYPNIYIKAKGENKTFKSKQKNI